MALNKTTKTIRFKDGKIKRYISIVHIAIYPDTYYKDINYDEPVLYLQQRRKKTKSKLEKVNEIFIPLSQIKYMG